MISRLSLLSLRRLKDQMKWCFNNCSMTKWELYAETLTQATTGISVEMRQAVERAQGSDTISAMATGVI